ncbi:hypothetical protein TNCV_2687761 [Trichonephila clavipes]|nr:hypothetical protein TNCV_2687761 [Trichonephila clavipes]
MLWKLSGDRDRMLADITGWAFGLHQSLAATSIKLLYPDFVSAAYITIRTHAARSYAEHRFVTDKHRALQAKWVTTSTGRKAGQTLSVSQSTLNCCAAYRQSILKAAPASGNTSISLQDRQQIVAGFTREYESAVSANSSSRAALSQASISAVVTICRHINNNFRGCDLGLRERIAHSDVTAAGAGHAAERSSFDEKSLASISVRHEL